MNCAGSGKENRLDFGVGIASVAGFGSYLVYSVYTLDIYTEWSMKRLSTSWRR
jgi:hypothetical protein